MPRPRAHARPFQIGYRRRQVRCCELFSVIMASCSVHAQGLRCRVVVALTCGHVDTWMGGGRSLMQHSPWAMLLPCVRHAQITTFATCLAQASSKDANYAAAMVALEQAERV